MYLVVVYVSALNSAWLYAVASLLSITYLAFVGYLVSVNLFPVSLSVERLLRRQSLEVGSASTIKRQGCV